MEPSQSERRSYNLLLFVIDTLRADRMSLYGNPRRTTPNLDAFARGAIVFDNAYAPSPHTVPSHSSLFTSTHPATHGVWNEVYFGPERQVHPKLSPNFVTLAEVLKSQGYQTAAIADGGWIHRSRGLAQGFQRFDSKLLGVENRLQTAISWLDDRDRGRPYFLFVHTYEVHAPYMPPRGYENRFSSGYQGPVREALEAAREWVKTAKMKDPLGELEMRFFAPLRKDMRDEDVEFLLALYDSELSLVDEAFARLWEYLKSEDLLDNTLIIITSDHGEEFGEHDMYGHHQVYHEVLRVPLIMRSPEGPFGVRYSGFVDLVDIMPTALSELRVGIPDTAVGRSLDLRAGGSPSEPHFLVGEVNQTRIARQVAVRSREAAVLFHGGDPERVEVFASGPERSERRDNPRSAEAEVSIARAREFVSEHHERAWRHRDQHRLEAVLPEKREISDEQLEQLRILGYIQD